MSPGTGPGAKEGVLNCLLIFISPMTDCEFEVLLKAKVI